MKTVLSVQDLSCIGRCSLTVALPVLSAMGCRCSVLPTAVLSTHTGFPHPEVVALTEQIPGFSRHFQAIDARFDAVTTGYMADPHQAQAVLALLRQCAARGSTVIVDPAMADHGKLYSRLNQAHVDVMAQLCAQADILLPNLTEACLLTGLPYEATPSRSRQEALLEALLTRFGAKAALITGVSGETGTIGFCGADSRGSFAHYVPVIPRQFHGTGDLFAAVFTGSLVQGACVEESGKKAADFVRRCIAATEIVTPHGVEFEPQLRYLFPTA